MERIKIQQWFSNRRAYEKRQGETDEEKANRKKKTKEHGLEMRRQLFEKLGKEKIENQKETKETKETLK